MKKFTEKKQHLLRAGMHLVDTTDTDDEGELGLIGNVEVSEL